MQSLSVAFAAVIVLNSTQMNRPKYLILGEVSLLTVWDDLTFGLNVMLSYRAFKRALSAPLLFPFEILVALLIVDNFKNESDSEFWKFWLFKYGILGLLVFAHFAIHRSRVFLNKLVYLVVSFATAFKNTKQRIKNQWICFLLQLTLLMPYFGAVLIWTTVFDVATIPTFGFAFFTAGYLKPQRMWSTISPVQANPKEQVSDGHLFQAMQG